MLAATLFGIGVGVALAILPHLLRPTFDNPVSLARSTGLPVLGSVSYLRKAADVLQTRREIRRLALACSALLVVGGVLTFFGNVGARAVQDLLA